MEYPILEKINSPADVKALTQEELEPLCEEIRNCIINTVAQNGGHLASNLGAVELTVALHRVFESPKDAIIFDVGHQSYTHKLLTGRFRQFSTLRTENGISGFMRPQESEHDPFVTGHSSNSISAAYGIYKAKTLKGEDGTAIAVIGDGAMTGGMAYEGLNNAGNEDSRFIVILNDNKMSISTNVGAIARSLTKMRNKPRYHSFKYALSNFFLSIPVVGKYLNKFARAFKELLKGMVYKNNFFSVLGFNYFGPVDGHNIKEMESVFTAARLYNRPAFIHVVTTKGKGYPFAEMSPKNYHGVSPFDIEEGISGGDRINFSVVAGKTLCRLAESDSRICAITAAMTDSTGLSEFSHRFTDRFFDVGIAEQHAVTFGAGLAKQGMKPYFVVYSSFLQRGFDQLVHDVAIGEFPLRLLIDRAGIVGEDGKSHQGIFDVSFLTCIPGMQVYSPSNYEELEYRIEYISRRDGVFAVRYPRGCEKPCVPVDYKDDFSFLSGGNEKLVVTYGRLFSEAAQAAAEDSGISVLKLNRIYPLPQKAVDIAKKYKKICFFEETVKSGGIGEHLAAKLLESGYDGRYSVNAIENEFIDACEISKALRKCGLDSQAMLEK